MESVFETKEQYLAMREEWKKATNNKELRKSITGEEYALYAILRKKDWRKAFAETSTDQTIYRIESYLAKCKHEFMYLCSFGDTVTKEMIDKIRENGIQKWDEA